MRTALGVITTAFALCVCGCGSASAPLPPSVQPAASDSPQKLPKLDHGWKPYLSRATGLALGRPPGWSVTARKTTTLLRSPDHLVAVTISADRTGEGLAIAPAQFAARTFGALPGYEGALNPSQPRRFRGHYDGSEVSGDAVATSSALRQRLSVIILRRKARVTFTVVIAANAKRRTPVEERQAAQIARTIRDQPSAGAPSPD